MGWYLSGYWLKERKELRQQFTNKVPRHLSFLAASTWLLTNSAYSLSLFYLNRKREMVWEVFLYMCCFYWFMNKAVSNQWLSRVKPDGKSKQR